MNRLTSVGSLIVVGLVATGCGSNPATYADACYDYGVTYCSRAKDCGGLGSSTENDCRSAFTSSCCNGINNTGQATCAGSLPNASRFHKCDDAIRSLTCGSVLGGLWPTEACQGWGQP